MRLPTSVNETEVVFAEPFGDPSSRWVSGRNKWVLLVSLGVVFFTLLTLYASARDRHHPDTLRRRSDWHYPDLGFGRRLMWGSDWPVVTRFGGTYGACWRRRHD